MRHLYAIGIKFVLVGTVISSLFSIFFNASLASLLVMSIFIALASYAIGDLVILPHLGNVISSVLDFGVYFLAIWTLSGLMIGIEQGITLATLAATYFLTLAEPLFHAYIIERVLRLERTRVVIPMEEFQTEAGEEKVISLKDLKRKKKDSKEK